MATMIHEIVRDVALGIDHPHNAATAEVGARVIVIVGIKPDAVQDHGRHVAETVTEGEEAKADHRIDEEVGAGLPAVEDVVVAVAADPHEEGLLLGHVVDRHLVQGLVLAHRQLGKKKRPPRKLSNH